MSRIEIASRVIRSFNPARITLISLPSLRSASTLVVGEHEKGVLNSATRNAVAAATSLGEGASVSVLLGGYGSSVHEAAKHAASSLSAISEVWVVDWEKVEHGLAEPWAELVLEAHKKGNFSHIVAASTSFGKNVLPRAAALLERAVISDVTKVLDDETFVRPVYAGNALSTVRYKGSAPCFLTVRTISFPAAESLRSTDAPISALDHTEIKSEVFGCSEWVEQQLHRSKRPELGSARVVVSGGRALKNAENFKILEKLADRLGGAVGASRAAVDGKMVPNDMQVGQTGKVVAPDLYIAVGISGALQHLAGMKDSKVIVAINKDNDSPIFQVADYGIAGDLFQIVPELIEKLPEKGQAPVAAPTGSLAWIGEGLTSTF